MDNSTKTRKSILKAAHKTFLRQGYGGARTQEIADLAKVNKALLHYHFRNKELLFREVLNTEVSRVQKAFSILESDDLPYPEKLRQFSLAMGRLADKNPDCLPFVLQASRQHPELLERPLSELLSLDKFLQQIQTGMSHGFIPGQNPENLAARLLALALLLPLAGDLVASLIGQEASDHYRTELPQQLSRLLAVDLS